MTPTDDHDRYVFPARDLFQAHDFLGRASDARRASVQLAVQDKVGDLFIRRVLRQVLDRIAAIREPGFVGADGRFASHNAGQAGRIEISVAARLTPSAGASCATMDHGRPPGSHNTATVGRVKARVPLQELGSPASRQGAPGLSPFRIYQHAHVSCAGSGVDSGRVDRPAALLRQKRTTLELVGQDASATIHL